MAVYYPQVFDAADEAAARAIILTDEGEGADTATRWARETPYLVELLREHLRLGPERLVLDYGCGSGILAIGAAMLGAAEVHAVDIDPDALVATQANARANQVQIQTGSSALASGSYPLVVANILAAPLKVLAPLLCAHVALGGHLLLAGILKRQTEEIQAAYQPFLALQVADEQDGWVLMHAVRV